jgi:GT2 family glycosyltransferase
LPSIALAVPCFREARRVPSLGQALRALDPRPTTLLLLDDGSDDGTAEALRGIDDATLLTHPENRGLGAGRNTLWQAAERAGNDVIAYLDADAEPPHDWVGRLRRGWDAADPRVAGLGGPNHEGDATSRADRFRARYWTQSLGAAGNEDASMLIGACSSYRVAALKAVSGFDPRFRTNGEDVDVGRRLRAAGYRLRDDPGLAVTHRRHDDAASLISMCYRHCRDGMRAARKTPSLAPTPTALVGGMAKKAVWAPLGGLRRGDPLEAALSIAACSAGLLGYAVAFRKEPPR